MAAYFTDHFNYTVVIILMMVGLYVVFASRNKIKKLVGLSVFQTSVFLFYITLGKVRGGQPPILEPQDQLYEYDQLATATTDPVLYSNPLPHVLILTAIVVGVAVLAIGLALVVRIREVYGTIEDAKIDELDYLYNLEGTDDPAGGAVS